MFEIIVEDLIYRNSFTLSILHKIKINIALIISPAPYISAGFLFAKVNNPYPED